MNRYAWTAVAALAALLFVATPTSAGPDDAPGFAVLFPGGGSSILGLEEDDGVIYTATRAGLVKALSAQDESEVWRLDITSLGEIRDMAADDDALYVVMGDERSPGAEPVVRIEKADGSVTWRSTQAWLDAGLQHPTDPVSIGIDPDSADPYLYVGTLQAEIIKMEKATGLPVLQGGDPLMAAFDNPLAQGAPNGIYAIGVTGDQLLAAWNFGGEDNRGNTIQAFRVHQLNRIIHLDTATLDAWNGQPTVVTATSFGDNPNGQALYPSYYDIEFDTFNLDEDHHRVYLAGFALDDTGLFQRWYWARATDSGPAPEPPRNIFTNGDTTAGAPNSAAVGLGVGAGGWRVAFDATHVYGITFRNQTDQGSADSTGWALKLNRGDMLADGGADGWTTDTGDGVFPGRALQAGDGGAIAVPADGDMVYVGHKEVRQLPFPNLKLGTQTINHATGGLLLGIPKDDAPVAVLLRPGFNEVIGTLYPIAYRTNAPSPDGSAIDVSVELYTRTDDDPTWRLFEGYQAPVQPGGVYIASNAVNFESLDSALGYRFMLLVKDGEGREYRDIADFETHVDHDLPVIDSFAPLEAKVVTTDRPTIRLELSDETSGVFAGGSGIWIDDVAATSYPVKFTFGSFGPHSRVPATAMEVDLSTLQPGQAGDKPVTLTQGPHNVVAVVRDFAGNVVEKRWSFVVDSMVEAPQVTPAPNAFVGAQPKLVVQLKEPGSLLHWSLDGEDVTADVSLFPIHEAQNPDGQRYTYRPQGLASGTSHTFSFTIQDVHGNILGPITRTFRVDTVAPELTGHAPAGGDIVPDVQTIKVGLKDTASGVDRSTLKATINGIQAATSLQDGTLTITPAGRLPDGVHDVRVQVKDRAGNLRDETWQFRVDRLSPGVQVTLGFPGDQTAVKRGDTLRLTAAVADSGALERVVADVRGLNADLGGAAAMSLEGDVYVLDVPVQASTTGPALIRVTAVDQGGHTGSASISVMVDNQAPKVFMSELPPRSAGLVTLNWNDDPPDALVGSGIHRFIVEQQVGDGPWTVIASDLTGRRLAVDLTDAEDTIYRFRVRAVDNAGNEQLVPSNAVQTVATSGPFSFVLAPAKITLGGPVEFVATPRQGVSLSNATAVLRPVGGEPIVVPLSLAGSDLRGTLDTAALAPGAYVLRYHALDASGMELSSASMPVTLAVEEAPVLDAPDKESPGIGLGILLACVAFFATRRKD